MARSHVSLAHFIFITRLLFCLLFFSCAFSGAWFCSQASAVGRYQQSHRDDVHDHEHHLQEGALWVRVGLRALANVHGGASADFAAALKTHETGPDEPGKGNSAEEGVADTDKHVELLVLCALVDHLDN